MDFPDWQLVAASIDELAHGDERANAEQLAASLRARIRDLRLKVRSLLAAAEEPASSRS